jgi:HAE1 family hydrophobic/amphiphilic exporter-1
MPRIQRILAEQIPADDELVITYGGDFEDLMTYGRTFIYVLIVSVFLVFGVMASQFESFLDPFIIIFTIPLTLVGVIVLYVATGTNFSLFTAVGLVMLVGIVVNNGIVLVDYTNLLRKRGLPLRDAAVEAGGNRLRPILMTTLTTVLGLLPVAFASGEGSSLVQPIAKTVVGGLAVATVLTLYLIPVIYTVFNREGTRPQAAHQEAI